MEKTWASGAKELIEHADTHIKLDSAFDKRIAFISIDNSVEISIRTFLALPKSKSGIKINRQILEDASSSFSKLLELLYKHAADKLIGIDDSDIEHYHRIRNKLYHEGTGLSVDQQYLNAYRSIAGLLLEKLFGVSLKPISEQQLTLENLILNSNEIEEIFKNKMESRGLHGTYKFEEAFAIGLFKPEDIQLLTEFRIARNRLVHSESIDEEEVKYWVIKSKDILQKIK